MQLEGIHHISAITGDARRNVDFYTRVLGMRLIAKTVNQDDPSVYHLFYGDEEAHSGRGPDVLRVPASRTPAVRAPAWSTGSSIASARRSRSCSGPSGCEAEGIPVERDEGSVRFADPERLAHELVVDTSGDAPLSAAHPEIPAELALRGFEGVRAYCVAPDRLRARCWSA